MPANSKEIIAYLETNYPQSADQFDFSNLPDVNFRFEDKVLTQFVIGAAAGNRFSPDIRAYEHYMKESLARISGNVNCVPWPYYGYEMEEMKIALSELTEHFGVKIDVSRIIKDLEVPRDESGIYYIIVTVIRYVIAYVA